MPVDENVNDRIVGVLQVVNMANGLLDRDDETVFRALACQYASTIERCGVALAAKPKELAPNVTQPNQVAPHSPTLSKPPSDPNCWEIKPESASLSWFTLHLNFAVVVLHDLSDKVKPEPTPTFLILIRNAIKGWKIFSLSSGGSQYHNPGSRQRHGHPVATGEPG